MHNKFERIDGIFAAFFMLTEKKIQVTKSNQNKIVPLMVSIGNSVAVVGCFFSSSP